MARQPGIARVDVNCLDKAAEAHQKNAKKGERRIEAFLTRFVGFHQKSKSSGFRERLPSLPWVLTCYFRLTALDARRRAHDAKKGAARLQPKQFAQPLGLRPAYGDFRLFLVVHA